MKFIKDDLILYAVTDRQWLRENENLAQVVELAIQGGVTMVQLREKKLPESDFISEAIKIKEICKKYHVPFIINDNLAVAKAVDADGIHVGQSDLNVSEIKNNWHEEKIIGVSAKNISQAIEAQNNGADYLGVGALFPTDTKKDAEYVTHEELKSIVAAVNIPVCGIGGIHKKNINELYDTKIAGVALVSEIFAAKNILENTKELKVLANKFKDGK